MKTQREIPIVGAVSEASFASKAVISGFKSYREAVQWCWQNRPCHGMTEQEDQSLCARVLGLHAPHMSRCLNPNTKAPMKLDPDMLPAFESYTGWRAASQYLAACANLTFIEELMEERKAAA